MSIISVRSTDPSIDPSKPSASSVFTGVLTSIRHRGAATSFLVRSIVDDTGVEVRYHLASPLLKDVRRFKKAGQADAAGNIQIKKVKMARVNFLERQPQRMPNVKGAVREQQRGREQERRRAPRR